MIHQYLYDLDSPVLIVHKDTGITYHNQVGGCACNQVEQEGWLLPLIISKEWQDTRWFNTDFWYAEYGPKFPWDIYDYKESLNKKVFSIDDITRLGWASALNNKFGMHRWKKWKDFKYDIESMFSYLNLKIVESKSNSEAWIECTIKIATSTYLVEENSKEVFIATLTWKNCD